MASASANIIWNGTPSQISNDIGFSQRTNLFFAYTLLRYMTPFVPRDSGMLSQNTTVTADKKQGHIKYNELYAHRMYEGVSYNFRKDKHPLATAQWDKACWATYEERITREVDNYRRVFG